MRQEHKCSICRQPYHKKTTCPLRIPTPHPDAVITGLRQQLAQEIDATETQRQAAEQMRRALDRALEENRGLQDEVRRQAAAIRSLKERLEIAQRGEAHACASA